MRTVLVSGDRRIELEMREGVLHCGDIQVGLNELRHDPGSFILTDDRPAALEALGIDADDPAALRVSTGDNGIAYMVGEVVDDHEYDNSVDEQEAEDGWSK